MINVNKLGIQGATALNRLREPEFDSVITTLQGELEEAKQKLVHADETVYIHRLQGRAEAFEDLLKAIEESRKVLSR
jgi:trehalose-6-phosphate synthase